MTYLFILLFILYCVLVILISKKIHLVSLKCNYKCSQFLTKNLLRMSFLDKIKRSFTRLVFLRSPKHFNIGKIQVFQSNSNILLLYPLNFFLFSKNLNFFISLKSFLINFPMLPTMYLKHIELSYNVTVRIKF